jgi:hypothetical protein
MSDQLAGQKPFELAGVRNREDYADALARLIDRGPAVGHRGLRRGRTAGPIRLARADGAAEPAGRDPGQPDLQPPRRLTRG